MIKSENYGKRVAFVTGGSGVIGAEICSALAECGFWVAVGYNDNRDNADKLADNICLKGGRAIAVKCNVADYESICEAKAHIDKIFGFTDTVVNNAGSAAYRLFCDETEESIKSIVEVDLLGCMFVSRIFTPPMISNAFGRIVNISSVWGVCGAAMETVYSAAKAGVIGFTKALALELAPSGITVNSVSPGFIDTPMNSRFTQNELKEILSEIPSCRFGTAADIAAAVMFLVNEDASYVVGQNLVVSGGFVS